MPQIKEYTRRVGAPGPVGGRRISGDSISLGRGIQQAGQAIQNATATFADLEEQRQAFDVQMTASKEQADLLEWFEQQKQQAPAGAPNFAENVKKELDRRKEAALEGAQSDFMRKGIEAKFTQVHNSLKGEALGFEMHSQKEKTLLEVQELGEKNANIVRANPRRLADVWREEAQAINANPYLDANTKMKVAQKRQLELHDTAMDGEVTALETNDKVTSGQILAKINEYKKEGSQWKEFGSSNGYDDAVTRLEKLYRLRSNVEDESKFRDFKEKMDQYAATGKNNSAYSPEWIDANVSDPDKKYQMNKIWMVADAVGKVRKEHEGSSFADIGKSLKEQEAALATSSEFNRDNARYQATAQLYNKMLGDFKEDQGGFAINNSKLVANNYAQMEKVLGSDATPEAKQAAVKLFAESSLAEQQRLAPGAIPTLLGKAQVGEIKAVMQSMKLSETGYIDGARRLQAEMAKWGPEYGPIVAKDLLANEAINPEQYVAALMFNQPESTFVAEEIMQASSTKISLLQGDDGETAMKDAQTNARAALADFAKTTRYMTGGKEIEGAFVDAVAKVALLRKSNGGSADYDAIAKEVVTNHYHFEDSYRVPKNIDPDAVARGAQSIVMDLGNMDLVDPESLAKIDNKDAAAEYMKYVRRHGRWVNDNDQGLRLVVPISDGLSRQVMEIKNGKTAPVQRTWDQLLTERNPIVQAAEGVQAVRQGGTAMELEVARRIERLRK